MCGLCQIIAYNSNFVWSSIPSRNSPQIANTPGHSLGASSQPAGFFWPWAPSPPHCRSFSFLYSSLLGVGGRKKPAWVLYQFNPPFHFISFLVICNYNFGAFLFCLILDWTFRAISGPFWAAWAVLGYFWPCILNQFSFQYVAVSQPSYKCRQHLLTSCPLSIIQPHFSPSRMIASCHRTVWNQGSRITREPGGMDCISVILVDTDV